MKILKNVCAILLIVSLSLGLIGCAEGDEYDNFDPVGVRVVEAISGAKYETVIEDEKTTKKMWNQFDSLVIDTEKRGEMGTAYLYMCFYNEDQSTLGIFTIYENGSCCLGEDFENFYTVQNGENIYLELCDIYTEYEAENETDNESE